MNYIFFHTITKNEKLLIAWVKHYYPEFNLSFSGLGWVTFKTPSQVLMTSLLMKMNCPLALRWGIGTDLVKLKNHDLTPLISTMESLLKEQNAEHQKISSIHYFERAEIQTPQREHLAALEKFSLPINQPLSLGELSLQIFKFQEGQFATGISLQNSFQSPYCGAIGPAKLAVHSPSRAYLKLAQLHDFFQFRWKKNDLVLEIGAAPGGITTFLLEQELRVNANDSAPLKIPHHPNLKTIIDSVQRIKPEEIPLDTKWIVSDLNLSPKQMIQEILRLTVNLNNVQGMMLTFKLPKAELILKLEYYIELLAKQFPHFKFTLMQVPSHKQETHLIGLK